MTATGFSAWTSRNTMKKHLIFALSPDNSVAQPINHIVNEKSDIYNPATDRFGTDDVILQ